MTNKIALRTAEEFMADYTPIYQPFYPLLLQGKSQAHSEVVGKITNRRLEAVGDLRMKHITPKDTEIKQIATKEGEKVFKKYFLGNQYVQSDLQDTQGIEDVIVQVLDENQKLQDDLLLLGEGTSGSDVVNNGVFYSGDSNYTLESSIEIAKATDGTHIADLHTQVVSASIKANLVAGRKLVVFYGTTMIPKVSSLYSASQKSFLSALKEVLGANYEVVLLPADVTPAGANGWMIINLDQIKVHYTTLPKLKNQGQNEEEGHLWHNFIAGSMMVEVLAKHGIIRQPTTFAA